MLASASASLIALASSSSASTYTGRLSMSLLLPIEQRRSDFTQTEAIDYPESDTRILQTAVDCANVLLQNLGCDTAEASLKRLSEDGGAIVFAPVGAKSKVPGAQRIAVAVLPNADDLPALKRYAENDQWGTKTKPMILVTPQWNPGGEGYNVVSDFGFGPWRAANEKFVDSFSLAYALVERRIGAASTLDATGDNMGRGGVARLVFGGSTSDEPWSVWAMGGDGSSALIGTLASSGAGNNKPPPYAEIEQLFRDAGTAASLRTRRSGQARSLEDKLEEKVGESGSVADWSLMSTAEVAAALRAGTVTSGDVASWNKDVCRKACDALDLSSAGKVEALRERIVAAMEKETSEAKK